MIANTPKTPYYAVIFTSIMTNFDQGYNDTSDRMLALAKEQKGFLGIESVRNNLGITISYWDTLENIKVWKKVSEHKQAQTKGRKDWYANYKVRICKVERDYQF